MTGAKRSVPNGRRPAPSEFELYVNRLAFPNARRVAGRARSSGAWGRA